MSISSADSERLVDLFEFSFNYKAILVYGSLPRRKIAAEGSIRSGMDAAMESLLILLSEFLDPKRVLVPMEAKWKVKEGAVDRSLL